MLQAFVEDPSDPPDVWAHFKFKREMERISFWGATIFRGSMRQFGTHLPVINAGIGPRLLYDKDGQTSGILQPTNYVSDDVTPVNLHG